MKINLFNHLIITLFYSIISSCNTSDKNQKSQLNYWEDNTMNNGATIISRTGCFGIKNDNDSIICPLIYDNISCLNENLFLVRKKDKFGIMNSKGVFITPLKYDRIWDFQNGLAMVNVGFFHNYCGMLRPGKTGYIDTLGNEVIPLQYQYGYSFSCNRTVVALYGETKKKWQIRDNKGTVIKELPYQFIDEFYDNIAGCRDYNGNELFIDTNGNTICTNFTQSTFHEKKKKNYLSKNCSDRILVEKNKKYGFIDSNGTTKISYKYDFAQDFFFNQSICSLKGRYGVIGKNEETIIPFLYDEINHFVFKHEVSGFYLTQLNKKYGLIDISGQKILPNKYEAISYFSEGLFAARINDKWGIIDINDHIVLPFNYDYKGYSYNEGMELLIDNYKLNVQKYVECVNKCTFFLQ